MSFFIFKTFQALSTRRFCDTPLKTIYIRNRPYTFGVDEAMELSVVSRGTHVQNGINGASGRIKSEQVKLSDPHLTISSPLLKRPLCCHTFWLRDHCRCQICYDKEARQKKIDLLSMPWDNKVELCELRGGQLSITWNDGHQSTFDLDHLQAWSDSQLATNRFPRTLWGHELSGQLDRVTVVHESFMTEEGLRRMVRCMLEYGMCIVDQVPSTSEATQEVASRIGPNLRTFYGDFWNLGALDAHQDVGYSRGHLTVHTDHTYFVEPAGIIVLHCINRAGTGGESLLVDGFKAAELFRRQNPEGYEVLSRTAVPVRYVEEGQCHETYSPMLNHSKVTGELEQIRMNMYDRKPPSGLLAWQQGAFYSHLRHLVSLVRDPTVEISTQLSPGQVLFIDNWRILHGRKPYTGVRDLVGCYLSRTDYLNKARVFELFSD